MRIYNTYQFVHKDYYVQNKTTSSGSKAAVLKLFWFAAHCKTYNFLAHFVYKIKNTFIYFKLLIKISIEVGFFSFLKYAFTIFAAHLATSCGAPFENH
jgi:hypothetical protein